MGLSQCQCRFCPAWQRVQVQDHVQPVPGAVGDGPVQQREAGLLELEWPVVVLEVAVIERDPDRVEAERGQVASVVLGEERAHEPVEEQLVALLAEGREQGAPVLALGAGVASEEVLHVHPATDVVPAQQDRLALAVDDLAPGHPQHGVAAHQAPLPARPPFATGTRFEISESLGSV